jgi:hypothetical protein
VLFWFLVYVNKLETPTADLRAELETASENLGGLVAIPISHDQLGIAVAFD